MEEGIAHAGIWDAFGFAAHGVGGDIVTVAVGGGHGVGLEGAGVFGEDLNGGDAGCAILFRHIILVDFLRCEVRKGG